MIDDIAGLVNETFHQSSPFDNLAELNEKSGLIYHVDSSTSTFVIRTMFAEDLSIELKNVFDKPEDYPSLRLVGQEEKLAEKLEYFECDKEMGKNLKRLIAGKRFSVNERDVLNVSDPGDSLWFKEEDGIEIFFKLSQIGRMDNLIKLGPIATAEDALPVLQKMRPIFEKHFQVQELVANPVSFKLKAMKTPLFEDFTDLIRTGNITTELTDFLAEEELGAFFIQFSCARKLWLKIEKRLELELNFSNSMI